MHVNLYTLIFENSGKKTQIKMKRCLNEKNSGFSEMILQCTN